MLPPPLLYLLHLLLAAAALLTTNTLLLFILFTILRWLLLLRILFSRFCYRLFWLSFLLLGPFLYQITFSQLLISRLLRVSDREWVDVALIYDVAVDGFAGTGGPGSYRWVVLHFLNIVEVICHLLVSFLKSEGDGYFGGCWLFEGDTFLVFVFPLIDLEDPALKVAALANWDLLRSSNNWSRSLFIVIIRGWSWCRLLLKARLPTGNRWFGQSFTH